MNIPIFVLIVMTNILRGQYEYTEAASVYPYWSQVKLGIVSVNRGCIAFEKYFGILANHFSYAVTYDVGFDRIPEI